MPPDPQLSGAIGTKITSNTGEGHNFLVHGIGRVTIFYADVKGGSRFFNLAIFQNLQPSPSDNF